MRVMQVVTSRGWGGADHQACILAEELAAQMDCYMLAPHGHHIFTRLSQKVRGVPMTLGNGFRPSLIVPFVRFVRKEKINLIDFHSSHGHNFALLVRRLLPKVKFVVHRHICHRPSHNMLTRFKYFHAGVQRYICVSQAVTRAMLEHGLAPQHVVTILGAVPHPARNHNKQQQRQKIFAQYNLNTDLPLIATVANLFEHTKGYDTLLQALQQLKEDGIPVQAIFAGNGPDHKKIEDQCRTFNIYENVCFAGFVEDIYGLLAAADVFCFPSRNEALGLVVQEAAHTGCCIVATRTGGIPEMVEHEHSALLCSVGDAQQLATNLKRVLNDTDLRQRLASNAKRYVTENLTVEKMVAQTTQVYRQLLST